MHTPWGVAHIVETLAPGILWVSTASHGGAKVDAALNRTIPDYMRSESGWYEEDTEWAIVAVCFPAAFSAESVVNARDTLRNWYPDAYARFSGVVLAPERSSLRSEASAPFRAWLQRQGGPQ